MVVGGTSLVRGASVQPYPFRQGAGAGVCVGVGMLALERIASLGDPSRAARNLYDLGDEMRRCLGVFVTSGSVPPIRGVPAIGLARALGNRNA
jgi:hypothetical protein